MKNKKEAALAPKRRVGEIAKRRSSWEVPLVVEGIKPTRLTSGYCWLFTSFCPVGLSGLSTFDVDRVDAKLFFAGFTFLRDNKLEILNSSKSLLFSPSGRIVAKSHLPIPLTGALCKHQLISISCRDCLSSLRRRRRYCCRRCRVYHSSHSTSRLFLRQSLARLDKW